MAKALIFVLLANYLEFRFCKEQNDNMKGKFSIVSQLCPLTLCNVEMAKSSASLNIYKAKQPH